MKTTNTILREESLSDFVPLSFALDFNETREIYCFVGSMKSMKSVREHFGFHFLNYFLIISFFCEPLWVVL